MTRYSNSPGKQCFHHLGEALLFFVLPSIGYPLFHLFGINCIHFTNHHVAIGPRDRGWRETQQAIWLLVVNLKSSSRLYYSWVWILVCSTVALPTQMAVQLVEPRTDRLRSKNKYDYIQQEKTVEKKKRSLATQLGFDAGTVRMLPCMWRAPKPRPELLIWCQSSENASSHVLHARPRP